jgi:S-(hydroxymethyl)glutathione dehydrogenase/alcohol dehydrogenase
MKIQAGVLRVPERGIETLELELEPPGASQVLVRMAAIGVCGSDLHVVKREWPRPMPMVLGHEGAGTVEAIGTDVSAVKVGDRVVISWAAACGECTACRSGRRVACIKLREAISAGTMLDGTTGLSLGGETVFRMAATGCLADRIVIEESAALVIPPDIDLQDAAMLGCAALTGVGAVRYASTLKAGERALIVGAGGVGQFVVQGALLAGASDVICVDPNLDRGALARARGARTGTPDELPSLMQGRDGADVAFDAVGLPETTALALRHTRPGGLCVIVGMAPTGARLALDPLEFSNREKTLTGSVYGSEDPAIALPGLLEDVRRGRIELRALVGPTFPLAQAARAFDASLQGSAGRVLVTCNGAYDGTSESGRAEN